MAKLLEGKGLAEKIKSSLIHEIENMRGQNLPVPVLASVQVGRNAAADSYVGSQKRTASALGIEFQSHELNENIGEEELIEFINGLNADAKVNGIIIQMPLPKHIDYKKICQYILPCKDVEGVNACNLGRIIFGKMVVVPCTAQAVMKLLETSGVELRGKEVVVVGHSEIVGKPVALLLLEKLATVTVCHIATSEANKLKEHVSRAEVLIVAVGKPGIIKGEWIKEGAIVIDVGINRVNGRILGDVEFKEASRRASFITPVPGGVGPLTVIMLMRNLIETTKCKIDL